jgi:putative transposase
MQVLARKVKLYPNKTQAANLDRTLETCRRLYNHCLELRQDAYEIEGKTLTAPDCNRWFTCLRHDPKNWPYYSMLSVSVGQRVIRDVDTAYRAFFKRVKKGETPGFPRFKGRRFFSRFTYTYNQGTSLLDGKLYLRDALTEPAKCTKAVDRLAGCIKFRPRNPFPEGEITIKSVAVSKEHDNWYATFTFECEEKPFEKTGAVVGVDLGIENIAITSDGEFFENPQFFRVAESRIKRSSQRLSRCKKGSKRRQKARKLHAKLCAKVARQRAHLHQEISDKLTEDYDVIVVEDLNVKGMVKNEHLSKSISDVGWSKLVNKVKEKANRRGKEVREVNPAYTSQECSQCGEIVPKKLSERWHSCPHCGLELHRDVNAAVNILNRGLA